MATRSTKLARARRARGEKSLPPIPESPIQRTESDLSSAATPAPSPRTPTADGARQEGLEHARRGSPARRNVERDWPAHREARGEFVLKGSLDEQRAVRAVCSVLHGVLTLSYEERHSRGVTQGTVLAQVPLQDLAVGLQRGRRTLLTLATLYDEKMFDDIYCFAADQVTRNNWITVFRRMGVPIFDVSVDGHANELYPGDH